LKIYGYLMGLGRHFGAELNRNLEIPGSMLRIAPE
jgi:hypothetical protein